MARNLQNQQNIVPPDVIYPFGRIKDNPGDNTGTPINEALYGDIHQFFAKLFNHSGLTYNNLPDNNTNGFQLWEALRAGIAKFKDIEIYGSSQTLTNSIFGKLAVHFNLSQTASTFVLPPAALVDLYKRVPIVNTAVGDLMIQAGIGDSISGYSTIVLKSGSSAEFVISNAGIWYVLNIHRKESTDLIKKIIDIGSWDMDALGQKVVPHGLTLSKIRSVQVFIIDDGGFTVVPLTSVVNLGASFLAGGTVQWDGANITLRRFDDSFAGNIVGGTSQSAFDDVAYDSTAINRGYIVIEYLQN